MVGFHTHVKSSAAGSWWTLISSRFLNEPAGRRQILTKPWHKDDRLEFLLHLLAEPEDSSSVCPVQFAVIKEGLFLPKSAPPQRACAERVMAVLTGGSGGAACGGMGRGLHRVSYISVETPHVEPLLSPPHLRGRAGRPTAAVSGRSLIYTAPSRPISRLTS